MLKLLFILQELHENVKEKISRFCHVQVKNIALLCLLLPKNFYLVFGLIWNIFPSFQIENIITLYDVSNIWRVPLLLKVRIFTLQYCSSFEFNKPLTCVLLLRSRRLMRQFWRSLTSMGSSSNHYIFLFVHLGSEFLLYSCVIPFGINSLFISCSKTREPVLKEWTSRADICDLLVEPVGSCLFLSLNLRALSCVILRCSFWMSSFFPHRLELQWSESTQDYQILIFLCLRWTYY